jgi:hypothetical protein
MGARDRRTRTRTTSARPGLGRESRPPIPADQPLALRITATALLPEEAEPFAADFERALSPDHRTRET